MLEQDKGIKRLPRAGSAIMEDSRDRARFERKYGLAATVDRVAAEARGHNVWGRESLTYLSQP